jgi:transposase
MCQDSVFVGLDYASAFVQVCVMDGAGRMRLNRRCDNDWSAIAACVHAVGRRVRSAIESCGGSADLADQLVQRAGWSLDMAHPGFVKRMKQNPDKSDYSDAQMLADLVRVGYLPRVWLAPQAIRELRRLVRYRQQLVDQRRATKLRVSALLRDHRIQRPGGKSWTQRWQRWLQAQVLLPRESRWIVDQHVAAVEQLGQQIDAAQERLAQATQGDALVSRLQGFAGVGPVTACLLRAEIGEFERFRTGKQLSRFCGLTPRNASSGQRQADAGLIKAGNPHLRATLIQVAHALVRHDRRWCGFAARLLESGKPKCVILAAVANRWIRWLYYQVREMRPAA